MTDFTGHGFVLPPQGGEMVNYGPQQLYFKLRSEQTGGRLSIVQFHMPARLEGPPLHTDDHDEVFIVVAGEMTFQLGDEVSQAPAGSLVFVPTGERHTFANRQDAPAQLMTMFSPGGFEHFFEEVIAMSASGPPDVAALMARAASYGTTYFGMPIWRQ